MMRSFVGTGVAKYGLIAAIPLLLMLNGCGQSPQTVRDRSLKAGKALMAKGDYRRALLEFKNAVQAMPKDPEAQFEMGDAYAANGDLASAATAFRAVTELKPGRRDAQRRLMQLMTILGDRTLVATAEKQLQALLAASPADMTALNTLAFAELKLGEREKATRHLEEVLTRSPQQMASVILLAQAKLQDNDVAGAEEVLKHAAAQNANSPDAFVLLGRFYSGSGRPAEAEQQFQKALQIQPRNAPALFYLAILENAEGKKQAAEDLFRILSTHPEKVYWPAYAMFLFQEGRTAEAVREFERLYQKDPGDRMARTRLVAVYQSVNRSADAEKLIDTALKQDPGDLGALLQRSALRLDRGRIADAQTDLNQVLRGSSAMPEAHFLEARLDESSGLVLSERQELNETLRLNPLFLPARIALAHLLIQKEGAAKAALELLDETPDEQKASLAILVEKNWAFESLGNLTEMERGIQQGLAVQRTPDLLIQYATLQLKRKNFGDARLAAEEALKGAPDDVRALDLMARSYAGQNQIGTAEAKLQEYAARQSQSAVVQVFLGRWLQSHGDMIAARAALGRAKSADSGSADADLALAQLNLAEGKWDDARKQIAAILAQNSNNITARYWLAQLNRIQGNDAASIEEYRRVITADPANANALNNLAVLLSERGDFSGEVLTLAQRAKELAPDSAAISDTLGWLLYQNGLYERAVRELEEANLRGATALRASHLSMAYLKSGSPDLARQVFKKAIQMDPNLPEVKEAGDLLRTATR